MSLRRLRTGELLAGVGALALLGLLFADWFSLAWTGAFPVVSESGSAVVASTDAPATSGWSSLGWLMNLALIVVMGLALWLVASVATARVVSQQMAAAVLTAVLGGIVTLALVILVLVAQPDLGLGAPDRLVYAEVPAYLGIVATAAIALGGWLSMADERTDAPESAVIPPPPLPPPG